MQAVSNVFPLREAQENTAVSDVKSYDDDESDLLINNLIYSMPRALSLATARSHSKMYPQRSSYTVDRSNTIIFDWNSGNNYINPANSYLKFSLTATTTDAKDAATTDYLYFSSGSAINLFNSTRIRSRSGTELARTENLPMFSQIMLSYGKTEQWKNSVGELFQYNQGNAGSAIPVERFNSLNSVTYVIPLEELDMFFKPLKKGQLLPPQLGSGLRIELSLEDVRRAFVVVANTTGVTVVMDNIEMSLDSVSLADDVQRSLNLESSQSGLEWTYNRAYTVSNTIASGQTSFNVQILKAVAQANMAFARLSNPARQLDLNVDSLAAVPYNFSSTQWRLGSLYFPIQPVKDYVANPSTTYSNSGAENLFMALEMFDKLKNPFQESAITRSDYVGGGSTAVTSNAIIGVSFEKNTDLSISGLSINNSRVLELLVEMQALAVPALRQLDTFLIYTSVAKAFVDNTAVAI